MRDEGAMQKMKCMDISFSGHLLREVQGAGIRVGRDDLCILLTKTSD